jgi:hypothetical protein
MEKNDLILNDLYTIQDALIHYKYGWRVPSHTPQTKDKIRTIQKKLLKMEENF